MKQESKIRAMMKWVGPAAIVGGTLTVISDQMGLVVHLPEMGHDTMGYHAVGNGLFLLVVTLLFVGMLGLYARRPDPRDARVIEYGDATARYVLVEEDEHVGRGTPLRDTRPAPSRAARRAPRRARTTVR
jgi:hypothetical protein